MGSYFAAFISGTAGFGGALLLLPLLSWSMGPATAVPVLTLAQLIGNLSRAGAGFKEIRWKQVVLFLVTAVPFSILGALSFVSLSREIIMKLIGACVMAFALLKFFKLLKPKAGKTSLLLGGGITGLLSGLLGSAGPMGAAVFLAQNLPPVAYLASEAVTATVMHLVKTVIYQKYIDIGLLEIGMAGAIGVFMVLGTFCGKRMIEKMEKERFTTLVTVLLAVLGIIMLIKGS